MKVLPTTPLVFVTGDVLDPADLNSTWQYAKDALQDVASKQWEHGWVLFPFVEDVGTAYTNASGLEERSYRFLCPVTCIVERAFLSANLTCAVELVVNITTTGGATPTGATTPWLTTGGTVASATSDTTDINVDRVLLVAGVEYKIVVTSAGIFTLNRFDVLLHLAVDRWTPAGARVAPNFDPTLLNDSNAADATVVVANNASLATEAARLASGLVAPAPMLFVVHNILSGTSANLRTFTVPRYDSARAQSKITRIILFAVTAAAGVFDITAVLKDETGATLTTVTATMTGVTQKTVDSGALTRSMVAASAGITGDPTKDYTLVLANGSAGTNAIKVYALVWFGRA